MIAGDLELLLDPVVELAKKAGQAILQVYQEANTHVVLKEDGSPLTEADQYANELITTGLNQLFPLWPILSEEGTDIPFAERAEWERYWLVDPLDGTKEFIQKTDEFTVNIALIEQHHVILGVVYAPVLKACYFAGRHIGAFKQIGDQQPHAIQVAPWQGGKIKLVASRRHGIEPLQAVLEGLREHELTYSGSSLKFCKIAEGAADVYPRLATTSEWDTAAAQCIVEQAGGAVIDMYGLPLQYNTSDSLQNPHFLVVGDVHHDWLKYFKKG